MAISNGYNDMVLQQRFESNSRQPSVHAAMNAPVVSRPFGGSCPRTHQPVLSKRGKCLIRFLAEVLPRPGSLNL